MTADSCSVTVELHPDDQWAKTRYLMRHDWMRYVKVAPIFLFAGVMTWGKQLKVLLEQRGFSEIEAGALLVAIGMGSLLLGYWLITSGDNFPSWALDKLPHTYTATNEMLSIQRRGMRTTLDWTEVQSVNETKKNVFVLLDRVTGYVIPKRSFNSPLACAEFVEFSRHCIAQAHQAKKA